MRLSKISFFILITNLLFVNVAQALIVSAGIGLGSTKMSNETTETEAPFTQAYTVERLFHSKLGCGVEHLRSMTSGLITSASFTGLLCHYYINGAPVKLYEPSELSSELIMIQDYSFFIGTGAGYGQSSRLPNSEGLSSNSAGIYVSPRFGVDRQVSTHVGIRGEFVMSQLLFGKGGLSQTSLGAAVYWMF